MSWIICSMKKIKYYMDKFDHPDRLNKSPW